MFFSSPGNSLRGKKKKNRFGIHKLLLFITLISLTYSLNGSKMWDINGIQKESKMQGNIYICSFAYEQKKGRF